MHPTGRTVLLLVLGVPVALAPVLVSEQLWLGWLGYLTGVIVLIGCDAILALPARALAVEATLPEALYMGDRDGALRVELISTRRQRAEVEVLVEVDPHVRPPAPERLQIGGGERGAVEVPMIPRRRGTAEVRDVWLRWRGPLGLTARRKRVSMTVRAPIIPNLRAVRAAALRYFARDSLIGLKIDKHRGDGSEFESLRDYVPGLDHRAIDWKHSARHRKLVCKEFRAERNHPIMIAIDTGQLMTEPIDGVPRVDSAINAGLLLGYVSLRAGDRVGLFGFDAGVRVFNEPAPGIAAFHRLQRSASTLDYHHEETNFTLGLADLTARLHRRTMIVLLTEFSDTVAAELMLENVARLSRKHLVVFVSLRNPGLSQIAAEAPLSPKAMARAVTAADFIREREVVLERLRRLGVLAVDSPPQNVGADLINQYLHVKRRELM